MIKPKKNPVTKIIGAGVKAATKAAGKAAGKKVNVNAKIAKAKADNARALKAAQKAKPLANSKSAVKTIKADPSRAIKFNQGSLMRTTDAATGAAARKGAAQLGVTGKKGAQPPVKINTEIFDALKRKIAAKQPLSKAEAKANKRGLKAANKPTKASKTFIGNNEKIRPDVRRDMIVNGTKPARPNRERGGSLGTLRKQGKTGKSK